MDMNDRSLRSIVVDLGGIANGYPRQDGFRYHCSIRNNGYLLFS